MIRQGRTHAAPLATSESSSSGAGAPIFSPNRNARGRAVTPRALDSAIADHALFEASRRMIVVTGIAPCVDKFGDFVRIRAAAIWCDDRSWHWRLVGDSGPARRLAGESLPIDRPITDSTFTAAHRLTDSRNTCGDDIIRASSSDECQ